MRYFVRARSESELGGAQRYWDSDPPVFYLFVVETLNAGSDMAMMDQPLVLQYGVCFFAFSLTDCLMRTEASNSTTSPVVRPVSPSVPAASLC
jgi:hypothetical protein